MSGQPLDGSHRRRLFSNTRDMLLLQVANYLLPLVLLTYLVRVLGVQLFGIYALGIGVTQLAFVFTDYGFSLSGAYSLSRRRGRLDFTRRFIGAAILIKATLLVGVAVLIATVDISQTKYPEYRIYFLLVLLPIAAEAAIPLWVFQGLEQFRMIAVATLTSRLLYVASVLALVRSPEQFGLLPLILALSHAGAGVVGWRALIKQGYMPLFPPWRFARQVFFAGTGFFLSRLAVAMYSSVGAVFIGATESAAQVALFSSAQQIYRALQNVVGMTSQALYPYMVKERDFVMLRVLTLFAGLFGLAGVTLVHFLGLQTVELAFGDHFAPAFATLEVLSAALAVYVISVFLGYPLFGALGRPDIANKTVMAAGVAQIGFLAVAYFSGATKATNVAMCVFGAEAVVLVLRLIWAGRYFSEWGWASRHHATEQLKQSS